MYILSSSSSFSFSFLSDVVGDGKNARGSITHNHESTAKKINNTRFKWFGHQLQPTSTRATIRFSFYPIAHQLQV